MQTNMRYTTGADQGFLVGGGADPRGAPTYDFVKISQKLHKIEKILGRGGGAGGTTLGSATGTRKYILTFPWQGNADRKVQEGRYPASQGF